MSKSQVVNIDTKNATSIPFVKEVAHYFMDFLETNFHKVRAPKRYFQQRDNNNLQVSVKIEKYPKYNALAWKVIRSGFKDDAINELKHGVFKNQIPKNLLQLIQQQIDLIKQEEIDKIIKKFKNEIDVALSKHKNDIVDASAFALDGITRVIKEDFLARFIEKISEPLEKIKTTTADSVYQIEEELTEIFTNPLEETVSMAITSKSLEQEFDVDERLNQNFTLSDIQNKLSSFFKGFAIADIFFEISELANNKSLLEKQEFYLNFCDITYQDRRYPLFYVPVQVTKAEGQFKLSFDSLLYVNKKAIQYVSQSYNAQNERKSTSLGSFMERIIYIAEKQEHLIGEIDIALKEAVTYFGLSPYIDINNPEVQIAKGNGVQVSNRCYFGLFDKSDESLVNDYEEILQKLNAGDDMLASAFEVLIDDFIKKNPDTVIDEVKIDWANQSSPDKLVYSSPIPLNEEQRQILTALNKSKCKYTTVEGPPGTGKSHTITAIVCDAILNNKSTLVLSDKKEALDVVEDKITETMNKVRFDKNFQNPILRLGKSSNNYSKIFSTTSMENIQEHYDAVKNEYGSIESSIEKSISGLKEKILGTIESYESIDIPEIVELNALEKEFSSKDFLPVDLEELYKNKKSDEKLKAIKTHMLFLREKLVSDNGIKKLFEKLYPNSSSVESFHSFLTIIEIVEVTKNDMQFSLSSLSHIQALSEEKLEMLESFICTLKQIRSGVFGYLFKGKQIRELCANLQKNIKHDFEKPHLYIEQLEAITHIFRFAEKIKTDFELSRNFQFSQDFIEWVCLLLKTNIALPDKEERNIINDTIKAIQKFSEEYPGTAEKAELSTDNVFGLFGNAITQYSEDEFTSLVRYLFLKNNINTKFQSIPEYSYAGEKAEVESLVTTQMTYKMDERVVDFYNNKRNDATSLKKIISKKQRFDKKVFENLKNAFPCILAGIRDFAEYIPLESEIFDIVIIDEASQVSIAQAFPALLRAKRVIVFGDKKQFSNLQSSQARSDTNREYLNRLKEVFIENISSDTIHLERLEKFNIKTSILDFFESINNYHIMLKKHFRGYKEIISYSSKYFYSDSLQAVKIRVKPIDMVIRFTNIDHDEKIEVNSNTNQLEIEAILAEVEALSKNNPSVSIGILTPFKDQQKLLCEAFSKHPEYENYCLNHKLKIMTFDTCQGEERDVILYSLVANTVTDKLWSIFIKDLNSVDLEEDGKIKAQRLNVGFSRAKECMHFFLSQPIEEYTGSIGEALTHYSKIKKIAEQLPDASDTDSRSPMENKVLGWLQETAFFKSNQAAIELQAQFPIGEYIKQLDKHYKHPKYVADFLLVFTDDENNQHKILIEYDGFEHHFEEHGSVDEMNYEKYYTEQHVYREKVLESYGYKFLRINRFNVGKKPIDTLNTRLAAFVKKKSKITKN
jgi:hypothetical protein